MGFHYPWSDCLFKTQSSALEYGGVLTPPVRNQLKNGYKHVLPFLPRPVLMYGSECWCLNATLLSKLESLQADLGKRILRLPRYTANSVPLMALRWPSMRCRCLCAKLTFLHKVCSGESDTLSCEVYKSLSFSDVESMMLVKQCRYLELQYSTNFTSEVLSHSVDSMRSLKKRVIQADQSLLLDKAKEHPSQSLVAHVASSVGCVDTVSLYTWGTLT